MTTATTSSTKGATVENGTVRVGRGGRVATRTTYADGTIEVMFVTDQSVGGYRPRCRKATAKQAATFQAK